MKIRKFLNNCVAREMPRHAVAMCAPLKQQKAHYILGMIFFACSFHVLHGVICAKCGMIKGDPTLQYCNRFPGDNRVSLHDTSHALLFNLPGAGSLWIYSLTCIK